MVTSLEPRETVLADVDSILEDALEDLRPRTVPREWRYAVPCAGVRYYAFRPAARDPVPKADAEPRPISAKLIDEQVILL